MISPPCSRLLDDRARGRDPHILDTPHDTLDTPDGDALRGLRVGILPASSLRELDTDTASAVGAAVSVARTLGAELVELDVEPFAHVLRTFAPIQQAEAFFVHHSRGLFPARRSEYGDDVRLRLELAESVSLGDYLTAATARERLREHLRSVFETVDMLLTPTGATRTPTLEALSDSASASAFRKLTLTHNVVQSLAGIPSCAVRAGFDRDGLPVGVQFSAPRWADERLLQVVDAFYVHTHSLQDEWPAG